MSFTKRTGRATLVEEGTRRIAVKRLLVAVCAACLVITLVMPVTSMVSSTPAHAANVVNAVGFPVSGTVFNPCNGEAVDFSGHIHFLVNVTGDMAGGFHLDIHDNTQGIHAVGETTEVQYVGTQTDHYTLNFTPGATNSTANGQFTEISQGSGPNFVVYYLLHVTVNADGTVTVFVDNLRLACQG
jgi:hypothetical protein